MRGGRRAARRAWPISSGRSRDKLPGGMAEDASAALDLDSILGGSSRAGAGPLGGGLTSHAASQPRTGEFGAFADLRIAFRPDARLHVVYGPNEAGKSLRSPPSAPSCSACRSDALCVSLPRPVARRRGDSRRLTVAASSSGGARGVGPLS